MKNIKKIIIPIVGIFAIFAIAINILFQPVQQLKTITEKLQAYNHQAENMLDNTFKIEDQIILPFIYKSTDDRITADDVKKDFKAKNLTIKNISTKSIGTGTQITIEESEDIYNVVVYADITGDGIVGLIDAQRIILNYQNSKTYPIEGLKAIAANVSNATSKINLPDAQRIIMFYLGDLTTSLVVNEPEEDPVIPSTPDEPSTPTTPSTPSTPTKDYITGIEITAPTTTEYVVGDTIDLTGGKITLQYKLGSTGTIDIEESMITGDTATSGTQTITVSYTTTNTSSGNSETFEKTFNITVYEENNTVNKIELGEGTFIYGTATTVDMNFYHKYSETLTRQITEVKKTDIDTTLATNFEITLSNKTTPSSEFVNQISIKPVGTINKEEGKDYDTQTLSIKVGEHKEDLEINVYPPALIVGDNASITLSLSNPQYVIIPISLNGEGIKASEIDTTNGKIEIIDSEEANFGLGVINTVKAYKKVGEDYKEVLTSDSTETADYIGIALLDGLTSTDVENLTITINYYIDGTERETPAATQTLTVTIQD